MLLKRKKKPTNKQQKNMFSYDTVNNLMLILMLSVYLCMYQILSEIKGLQLRSVLLLSIDAK